jgi:hypothetical protein
LIQIKPGTPTDGKQIPFISVLGGMAVESISGNSNTVLPSAIGDGYANSTSVYGGYEAHESPFGGIIAICGHISNPPNDPPDDNHKLEYKVQYRKAGDPGWKDITNKFRIWISTWDGVSWSMSHKDQTAPTGYYKYEEDLTPPVQRFIEGNVLAQWHTPVPEGDGLYEIRVLLRKPGALPSPGVPADHVSSNIVKVRVDNTRPDAEVSLDAGPCEFTTLALKLQENSKLRISISGTTAFWYCRMVHPLTISLNIGRFRHWYIHMGKNLHTRLCLHPE